MVTRAIAVVGLIAAIPPSAIAQTGGVQPVVTPSRPEGTFRGEVRLRGTYQIKAVEKYRTSDQEALTKIITGANKRNLVGSVDILLTIDGPAVDAELSATGGLESTKLSGLMKAGFCTLYAENGSAWTGKCGVDGFSGTIVRNDKEWNSKGTFEAIAIKVVDYEQRDREQAAQRAAVPSQSKRPFAGEAVPSRVAVAPASPARAPAVSDQPAKTRASGIVDVVLTKALRDDATNWFMNRLDEGSWGYSEYKGKTESGKGLYLLSYTYNGGNQGWIRGVFNTDNSLYCVVFHDFPATCRNPEPRNTAQVKRGSDGGSGPTPRCRTVWRSGGPNPNQQYPEIVCN